MRNGNCWAQYYPGCFVTVTYKARIIQHHKPFRKDYVGAIEAVDPTGISKSTDNNGILTVLDALGADAGAETTMPARPAWTAAPEGAPPACRLTIR